MHAALAAGRDGLLVKAEWNESELVKLVPGHRWRAAEKVWWLPLTWASLVTMRGVFTDHLELSQDVIDWTWDERRTRVDPATAKRALTAVTANGAEPLHVAGLYPFQDAGVDWMITAGSGLLGDEMGVGKTVQMLTFLELVGGYPAVVFCPNGVKHHWAARTREWTTANAYVVEGGTVAGRRVIAAAREDPRAILILNYEAARAFSRLAPYGSVALKRCRECDPRYGDENLTKARCHVHPKELNDFAFVSVVMDEAHRIGEPKSQQTRAVWAVSHGDDVRYRWALTGTPDNVERLWSIMHATVPAEYPTKTPWMDRYALRAWNAYGGLDVVGLRPDTREELYRILDPRFRRMLKELVLPQLPPIVREVRFCNLTAGQRRAYDELESRLYTRLEDGQLYVATNRLVSRTRLMQFAAGTVLVDKVDEERPDTWKVKIVEPSPKVDELEVVLEELGPTSRFVVACEHRDLVEIAAERLGRLGVRHQLIIGGTHPRVTEQACQDLKTGTLRALVFTIAAGGVGLDMSGADTMILLQRSWSLINQLQAEQRVHRIGSEVHESVRLIDVVTRDTREVRQVEALHEKMAQLEEITRDKAAIQQVLAVTPYDDARFMELVQKLDQLNAAYSRLLETDLEADALREVA